MVPLRQASAGQGSLLGLDELGAVRQENPDLAPVRVDELGLLSCLQRDQPLHQMGLPLARDVRLRHLAAACRDTLSNPVGIHTLLSKPSPVETPFLCRHWRHVVMIAWAEGWCSTIE